MRLLNLEAIDLLTADLNVSGLLWPVFIVGCEAEEKGLRAGIDKYFDKRETLGIANVPTARRVVSEVWKRRDQGDPGVSWHEVMAELGIDILLS
jgi:arginine metabolism regulation protein II